MKHTNFKLVSKLSLTFFITLLCLWLCLALASSIPNSAIKSNMQKSAQSFGMVEAFSFENGNKINSIADNYADSILLNLSYNAGKGNPFVSSVNTCYYDGEENGKNYGLYLTVNEEKEPNTDYTRYPHGSIIFVRLFHLFTDLDGMRLLSFCIILLMLIANLIILIYKKHYFLSLSLLLSLCSVQFWNIRLSLEYQSCFAVLFAMLWLFVINANKDNILMHLFCISGVATAFFDFLTTETVTCLIPLIAVLAIRTKQGRAHSLKEIIIFSLKCLFIWGIAYAGTFVAKWTLASILTENNCFKTALFSVSERFGGSFDGYFDQAENIFSSVYANIGVAFGTKERNSFMHAFSGSVIFLLVIFSIWYLFKNKKGEKLTSPVILTLGFMVIIRFLVLNNHSFLHCFFTYRALCSTVFALLTALWLNIKLPFKLQKK